MLVSLTGMWEEAKATFPELEKQIPNAIDQALRQEAEDLRKRIVQQFREQKPMSGSWAPLSPLTLRARKAQGFGGSKILIRTGDLRNSIQIQVIGKGQVFVGVNRTAGNATRASRNQKKSTKKGKQLTFKAITKAQVQAKPMSLVNLGEIHEFGAVVKVTVTKAMQAYFFGVLLKGAGKGGGGKGTFKVGAKLTIRIPARPFIGPAVNALSQSEYETAVAIKIAVILKGMLGKP